jgi:predicted dehydrogenase
MIKTAIIGYGYMGEIRHRVIDQHPDLELSMVCECSEDKLKGVHPFRVVRNPREVLDSDADLIFVCTPNNLIPNLVIEALKRGKHVFAEKPPGRNLQDILNIREQERKSPKAKLMFGFNHRYHPGIQRAKSITGSGQLGDILWVRGLYGKSGGKSFPTSWRNCREISGGGILLDQGIHMLDLFCYFCGDFPEVKSFMSNQYWGFDLEDDAFVIMTNPRRQHAMLHSSATLWKHRFVIEFGLQKGYVIVQGLLTKSGSYGRETLVVGRQAFEDETDAVGNPREEMTYFDRDLSWEIEVAKIVDCIKNDTPVQESSSLDAYKAMLIVDKAYRDAKFGPAEEIRDGIRHRSQRS